MDEATFPPIEVSAAVSKPVIAADPRVVRAEKFPASMSALILSAANLASFAATFACNFNCSAPVTSTAAGAVNDCVFGIPTFGSRLKRFLAAVVVFASSFPPERIAFNAASL